MRSITRNECPNTRAEFVTKWNTDHMFRARATARGFKVMFDNVIVPDGRVATPTVRQGQLPKFFQKMFDKQKEMCYTIFRKRGKQNEKTNYYLLPYL